MGKRVDVAAAGHGIDHSLVDEHAVRVVTTLQQAGHEAYIVGGAVRDLLVGRRPKDFDVATNATPEQVKQLFRRAFIIGRRSRLVHVVFGRGREHEVIEVSTFRAYRDASEADTVQGNERTSKAEMAGKTHVIDASGRVLRDNVWGPQIEDAARRDFTVNAMYYDPQTRVVVDFHHGIADAKRRVLRMIGDPATRYREDPVRLVRVVRFAAKLGFSIEKKTGTAMAEAVPLLANVPVSRLFDEMIKLLQTGHAWPASRRCAPTGCIAACSGARRDLRRAAQQPGAQAFHRARAGRHRPSGGRGRAWHRVSAGPPVVARRASALAGVAPARRAPDARAAAGHRCRVRCAHRRRLRTRPPGCRHA